MNQLRLWYHTALMNHYGRLVDSIEEDEEGMSDRDEEMWLIYYEKYEMHKSKVRQLRELQGA